MIFPEEVLYILHNRPEHYPEKAKRYDKDVDALIDFINQLDAKNESLRFSLRQLKMGGDADYAADYKGALEKIDAIIGNPRAVVDRWADMCKPIIPGDPKAGKEVDAYFAKRPLKTSKLVDPIKFCAAITSLAEDYHEKFMPNKAKSYKAGFDNGFDMGVYEGLLKAVLLVSSYKPLARKKVPKKNEERRILTGKELRVAARKHLPVYFVEKLCNSNQVNAFNDECYLEESFSGYFLGDSGKSVDTSYFKNKDLVECKDLHGTYMKVCAIKGVKYE